MNPLKKKKILKVSTIIVGGATLVIALYIMAKGLGLVDSLDFGAGAYFYADIPDYEKVDADGSFHTTVPRWVHFLLFFVWGAFVFWLWNKVDGSNDEDRNC